MTLPVIIAPPKARKRRPLHLRKVPYSTRLPQWLRDWLSSPEQIESGPVMIELALRKFYGIGPPTVSDTADKEIIV